MWMRGDPGKQGFVRKTMKLHRLIKNACEIASDDIGKANAEHIAKAAQERYEELCVENATDSKALRAHTYKRIYPAIAVYEVMRAEGISQEKAVWYIREYFQRFSAKMVPHIQRLIRVTGTARKIPKLFMIVSRKSFGMDAGFVYEYPESHGNEARCNIVHCPYFETCRRYGCPKITRAFCDGDDAGYGNMHPKLVWGRTKTIGRGGDCCDFWLEYRD